MATMKAVQLDEPGPPEVLQIRDLPMPAPPAGWVRIRVEAFGLNRSELHLRLGYVTNATFRRVPGIECAGTIDDPNGTSFRAGQKVVAMMGGMGRQFDGGYAEFVIVPAPQAIPIETNLPWETVGAVPEMLQTAYGSLITGLWGPYVQTEGLRRSESRSHHDHERPEDAPFCAKSVDHRTCVPTLLPVFSCYW